jgi:tetratricopeptide (TPR) repeat protein
MPLTPVSAAKRRELQTLFDRAIRLEQERSADPAEIRNLLGQCVAGDPANLLYADAFLRQLERQGATPDSWWDRVFDPRAKLRHAAKIADWAEVARLGVELLSQRPRDAEALAWMAQASAGYDAGEVELRWLHSAVAAASSDIEICRQLARSLTRQGQFEPAAKAWQGLLTLDRNDHEAAAALQSLGSARAHDPTSQMAELETQIKQSPHVRGPYLALVDHFVAAHRYEEAETVLARARPILGALPELTEKLEAVMIARARRQLEIAQKQAEPLSPLEAIDLVDQAKANLARVELQVFSTQSQRQPQNKQLLLEVGRRLKQLKNYSEAVKYFAQAAEDPALAPAATVETGECWQHLRQFPKALDFYRRGIELAEKSRDQPLVALAAYRAGTLADAMGNYVAARDFLRRVLLADPGYRDAQARLDKMPAG